MFGTPRLLSCALALAHSHHLGIKINTAAGQHHAPSTRCTHHYNTGPKHSHPHGKYHPHPPPRPSCRKSRSHAPIGTCRLQPDLGTLDRCAAQRAAGRCASDVRLFQITSRLQNAVGKVSAGGEWQRRVWTVESGATQVEASGGQRHCAAMCRD